MNYQIWTNDNAKNGLNGWSGVVQIKGTEFNSGRGSHFHIFYWIKNWNEKTALSVFNISKGTAVVLLWSYSQKRNLFTYLLFTQQCTSRTWTRDCIRFFFKIVLAGTGGAVEPGICRFLSFPLINSALGLSATVSPFIISFSVASLFLSN